MKEIQLTQGKVALVDDEDYERISRYKWQIMPRKYTAYAKTPMTVNGKRTTVLMHRFILGITNPKEIGEHRDGNGLNNQRSTNLRIANHSQNNANCFSRKNSSSKYKGVSWSKTHKNWLVVVCKDGKHKYVGRYKDEAAAALAFNRATEKLHGEFARLNKIEGE